jgi:hypothetical protein
MAYEWKKVDGGLDYHHGVRWSRLGEGTKDVCSGVVHRIGALTNITCIYSGWAHNVK